MKIITIKTPWMRIAIYNLIFLAFFGSAMVVSLYYGDLHTPLFVVAAIRSVAIVICGALTASILWVVHGEQQKGPWLIVDRLQGSVNLPRHGVAAPLVEVDQLQAISSTRYRAHRTLEDGDEFRSELS